MERIMLTVNEKEKKVYTITHIPTLQEANSVFEDFVSEGMDASIKNSENGTFSVIAEQKEKQDQRK